MATLKITDFSASDSLFLNGDALVVDGLLRLTSDETWQAGSAFSNQVLTIDADTDFSTQFQFELSGGDGAKGADGFTFLLNGGSSSALGAAGSKLGYGGISQSLAIEFDTYNWKEVNGNHVALLTNGNTSKHLSLGTPGFDLNGSGPLTAWIDYSGQSDKLSVYVSDSDTRPTSALLEHTIDIASVLGEDAYVGFSGGTGGLTNDQDILNWEFSSSESLYIDDGGSDDGGEFQNDLVLSGLSQPNAIVTLPDGRMLVAEKSGAIKLIDLQATSPSIANYLTIPNVDNFNEKGVFSLALDPSFESNGYVYVYYANKALDRLLVSRFTHQGSTASSSSEFIVWKDKIKASSFKWHPGGAMDIGPDGKVYIGTGDHLSPSAAQNLTSSAGKILRVNIDGSIPTDNPFYDGNGPNVDAIWAVGLANIPNGYLDQQSGKLFVPDVGKNGDSNGSIDEINIIEPGSNYGWPNVDGVTDSPSLTNPIYTHDRVSGKSFQGSIKGGFVYRGDQFPIALQGAYIFADAERDWIKYLKFDQTGNLLDYDSETAAIDAFPLIAGGIGEITAMAQGADDSLYYLKYGEGELRRVSFVSADPTPDTTAPTVTATTGNVSLAGGQTHQFEVLYTDATAVDISTLDNADILVSGPNGSNRLATLLNVAPSNDGSPRTATYQIAAPGGTWDAVDSGTYTISLKGNQVSDTAGNFSSAGTIGTFQVNIDADTSTDTDFNFVNFTDLSNLQLNGASAGVNGRLRLTPDQPWQAGTAFLDQALAIDGDTDFSTQFQFQLSQGDGVGGADGFTFLLQSGELDALGSAGSSLGYAGISQSLAIEFDTYKWKELNNNHVAVLTNGNTTNHLAIGSPAIDLNGGDIINAWIDYDGSTDQLDIYVSDNNVQPVGPVLSYDIDLDAVLGPTAYAGFSGGTGGLTNVQEILNWDLSFSEAAPSSEVPPSEVLEFQSRRILSGLNTPVSMTTLPDGHMLILEKGGAIKLVDPQAPNAEAIVYMTITDIDNNGERGLLDITLDPAFETNGYFYVYYSKKSADRMVISRFTHGVDGHNDHAHLSSEEVIWEDPSYTLSTVGNPWHNGGGLDFGPDGKLYLTMGDRQKHLAGHPQNPQYTAGKVIRLNKDGSIPLDNPFHDGAGPNLDEVWAVGLRNPFRARWEGQKFFIAEVGGNVGSSKEEINLGQKGANYGWPNVEGNASNSAFIDPLFAYEHEAVNGHEKGGSVTGGFVYNGDQFPSELQGAYIFGDFHQGWIRYLKFDPSGNPIDADPSTAKIDAFSLVSKIDGASRLGKLAPGTVVSLEQGSDGSLYYLNLPTGELAQVSYGGNQAPNITTATADPISGGLPLTVNFSGAASDLEGDPLSYTWFFGDGTQANGANASHTFNNKGSYSAQLSVSDGVNNPTVSSLLDIQVGLPPTVSITTPQNNSFFRAGDVIDIVATATDDGPLTSSDFSWDVGFVHNGHTHPAAEAKGKSLTLQVPSTDHDFHEDTSYSINLTVTDEDGLTTSKSIELFPEKVDLTFESSIPGATFTLDNVVSQTGTLIYDTAINFNHTIEASQTLLNNGAIYAFSHWSTGETTPTIGIITPEIDETFTAFYSLADGFALDFDTFTNVSELTLNGATEVVDGDLRLTSAQPWQTGSAFYNQAIAIDDMTSFSTEFQFKLSGGDGITGADGFTFMLQSDGLNTLGAAGSGLGYDGISQSVAVEFDTYKWKELNNNHVAVLKNGDKNKHLAIATPTVDLNGGDILNAWIDYDGTTNLLEVFVSGSANKPGASLLSHNIDLDAVLGSTAYAGFSGGTGGLTNAQDILNWEMSVV